MMAESRSIVPGLKKKRSSTQWQACIPESTLCLKTRSDWNKGSIVVEDIKRKNLGRDVLSELQTEREERLAIKTKFVEDINEIGSLGGKDDTVEVVKSLSPVRFLWSPGL